MSYNVSFPGGVVEYYFEEGIDALREIIGTRKAVMVTDSHVFALYQPLFAGFDTIVVPAGESSKNLESVEYITDQLIQFEADRHTLLVGVGGGVITDLAGFAASVYMRGMKFGFVPTTLLAMVDAAIGGKNGVNFGLHKNMLGTIRQPEFILCDTQFLHTLPTVEWSNGFAEVIKYGCIFDSFLFDKLLTHDIEYFRQHSAGLSALISTCANWKNRTVQEDETEQGSRKLLNFGHTVGHALEQLHELPHGFSVAIGMMIACRLSEKLAGLPEEVTISLRKLLVRFQLPTDLPFDPDEVMAVLKMDKKRNGDKIDFILLEQIGKARIQSISFDLVQDTLKEYGDAGDR